MSTRGMTLLEVMMATAIFTMVMGTLFSLALGFANAAEVQELKISTNEEARRALLILVPRLRQATRQSINWNELPGDSVRFRMPTDLSGNGAAVDSNGNIELTGVITIQRDENDENQDGMTWSQLVMIPDNADPPRVLANDLAQGLAPLGAGVAPPNGVGFWVAPRNGGLEVTVRSEGRTRRGRVFETAMTEFILPRN